MSQKEARRVYVIEQALTGQLSARKAGELLGLSARQIFRLKGGVKQNGPAALAHKNRGRTPWHAISPEVFRQIVSLALGDYQGASCAHMAELLAEHQALTLSPKTIARLLARANIPNLYTHRCARKRRSRERKPQEGMLIQCDASPHDWLEGRGPRMSLHGGIDDATGKIVGLHFRLEEDLNGYFQVLEQLLLNFGIPESLYSDRHTILLSPKTTKLSIAEEFAGLKAPLTHFGKALQALGIRHIPARSPQAKGRIERLWGTLQGRLVIELRLKKIRTMEEANAFLPTYVPRFNERFAVMARESLSAYQPRPPQWRLNQILCRRHERLTDAGSTISFEGRTYQLMGDKKKVLALRPREVVSVLVHRDGKLRAMHQENSYALREFTKPPIVQKTQAIKLNTRVPVKPAADHPWNLAAKLGRIKKAMTESQST